MIKVCQMPMHESVKMSLEVFSHTIRYRTKGQSTFRQDIKIGSTRKRIYSIWILIIVNDRLKSCTFEITFCMFRVVDVSQMQK